MPHDSGHYKTCKSALQSIFKVIHGCTLDKCFYFRIIYTILFWRLSRGKPGTLEIKETGVIGLQACPVLIFSPSSGIRQISKMWPKSWDFSLLKIQWNLHQIQCQIHTSKGCGHTSIYQTIYKVKKYMMNK